MKNKSYNVVDIFAIILVIVGALNWGLVGIFNVNVVAYIFGEMNMLTRIIYIIIGLAGLWMIFGFSKPAKPIPKTD
jgi:uncharacterized protein